MRPHCPPWLKTAVFYQIFPASYSDSNGDGIGDLPGIVSRLDYIASLGVNALWINPCFDSPFSDGGYDVRDFRLIAPRYGTNKDFDRLVDEAARRGIRVCLDFVAPHTSIDHPWFIESAKADPNPYTNRYLWSSNIYSSPRGHSGKPMESVRGYSERAGAFARSFFWCQPKLNFGYAEPRPDCPEHLSHDHPDIQALWNELKDSIRFWLDKGVAGFRCDSAKSVCMDAPANEPEKHARFWCEVNAMMKEEYPDTALFCEWGWPIDSVRAGFAGNLTLHNMKDYNSLFTPDGQPLSRGIPFFSEQGGDISRFIDAFMYHYDSVIDHGGYLGMMTSNHDSRRISTDRTPEMMECVFAMLMTMPAIPFVYYGEEIGMRHLPVRTVEGGYGRTGARTPMQWDSGDQAGFSTAPPSSFYTPIDPDPNRPNVLEQESDPASQLNRLRRLTALRHSHRALDADASFRLLSAKTICPPLVYERVKDGESIIVAINPRAADARCSIEPGTPGTSLTRLAGRGEWVRDADKTTCGIPATSYGIFIATKP